MHDGASKAGPPDAGHTAAAGASAPPPPSPRAALAGASDPEAASALDDRISSGEFTDAGSTKERMSRPVRKFFALDPVGPGERGGGERWEGGGERWEGGGDRGRRQPAPPPPSPPGGRDSPPLPFLGGKE
jgi:hypothetical protein